MKEITLSLDALAAIIALTILQACAGTAVTTQGAKPTLTPPSATVPVGSTITVRITTTTTGAKLLYTTDGSTPTSGPPPHGTEIAATSGTVQLRIIDVFGRTLRAIAFKPGSDDSPIAVGKYGPLQH
jgi:hypothetical protein